MNEQTMSTTTISCVPFIHGDIVLSLAALTKDKKQTQDKFGYYLAFWCNNTQQSNDSSTNKKSIPYINIRSNSIQFSSGFVSDMTKTMNKNVTYNSIFKHVGHTTDRMIIDIIGIEHVHNMDTFNPRICYTMYKKSSLDNSDQGSKMFTGSFSAKDLIIHLSAAIFLRKDKRFMMNIPTGDLTTYIGIESTCPSHEKKLDVRSIASMCELCNVMLLFNIDVTPSTVKQKELEDDVWVTVYKNLHGYVKTITRLSNSKKSDLPSGDVGTPFEHTKFSTEELEIMNKSFEPICDAMYCVNHHKDIFVSFNDLPTSIILYKIKNFRAYMNEDFEMIEDDTKNVNKVQSPSTNVDTFMNKTISNINDDKIKRWIHIEKMTNEYINRLNVGVLGVTSNKVTFCILRIETFDLISSINRTSRFDRKIEHVDPIEHLDRSNTLKKSKRLEKISKHATSFETDVGNLGNFKRYYWIIDNLRVPYPHFTKICVPKFVPTSYKHMIESTKLDHRLTSLNSKTEDLFLKLLKTSCMKYGIKEVENVKETIERAFMVTFESNNNNIPKNDLWFTHTKTSKEKGLSFDSNTYLSKNSSIQRRSLLSVVEVISDFLCSISCSLNYKCDTRIRNPTDYVNSMKTHTKDKIKRKTELNKSFEVDDSIVYQNVDSVDFDSLAGLNEEGDCDEMGIFIDYVFTLMCIGRTDLKIIPWENKILRSVSFFLLHYVDFCVFGVVDDAKFGSNNNSRSRQNLETRNDLIYNDFDKTSSCSAGHTFVILSPVGDIESTILENAYTKESEIKFANMFGASRQLVKTKFSEYYNQIYGGTSPQEKEQLVQKMQLISKSLPKLILEGTGRQNGLMLHSDYYYGEDAEISKIVAMRRKLTLDIAEVHRAAMQMSDFHNEDNISTGIKTPSLKKFDVCDFQAFVKIEETMIQKYEHRCVDFYRRATHSTSQVLRYIFCTNSSGNEEEYLLNVWDNLMWVNLAKKKWGVPVRHILEDNFGMVTPIPMPIELFHTYTTKVKERHGSKNYAVDHIMEMNLQARLPKANLSSPFETGNLQSITVDPITTINISKIPKLPIEFSEKLTSLYQSLASLTNNMSDMQRYLSVYWVIKPENCGIVEVSDLEMYKTKLNVSLQLLKKWMSSIFTDFDIIIEVIYQKTLPWFGEEITVVMHFEDYVYME